MDTDQPKDEKPVLYSRDPNRKVSEEDWSLIRDMVCAGKCATELAKQYGIEANTIHRKASTEKWPTPQRILKAQRRGLPTGDPAAEIAKLWSSRQGAAREQIFQGAKKSLDRFFAKSPVPQTFQEAAVAEKMMMKAIDPSEGKSQMDDPNLALLASGGEGMVIDVEEVEEEQEPPIPNISHTTITNNTPIPTTEIPPTNQSNSPQIGLEGNQS